MKELTLLVWLTQLGISVVAPLVGFVLLAVWLRGSLGWGNWVIWVGTILGIVCAVDGLLNSLKSMDRLAKKGKEQSPPPISFNDHA